MIPIPDNISPDDIGQWLYGGVCLARQPDGEWMPCVVDRVEDSYFAGDKIRWIVLGRLASDGFVMRQRVKQEDLRAHWPLCGSINVPHHRIATHVERVPSKQYKRTFNSRQLAFTLPRSWDIRRSRGTTPAQRCTAASNEVVSALFKPTYPVDYEDALAMLADGWLSVAVNPRIIVAGDIIGKRMIYYRGQLAATIHGDRISPVADALTCSLINRATGGRYTWNHT